MTKQCLGSIQASVKGGCSVQRECVLREDIHAGCFNLDLAAHLLVECRARLFFKAQIQSVFSQACGQKRKPETMIWCESRNTGKSDSCACRRLDSSTSSVNDQQIL